jgi:hypothetical protein
MNRAKIEREIWNIVNAAGGEYDFGDTEVRQIAAIVEEQIKATFEECEEIAEDEQISMDHVVGGRIAAAIRKRKNEV